MSRSYRRLTAKKLQEIINTATDPMVVIEASNALAKFLPKPKQQKRRPGTPVAPKKEPTLDELIAAMEKKRKGKELTEAEKQAINGVDVGKFVAAVEKKRKELYGGSAEVA